MTSTTSPVVVQQGMWRISAEMLLGIEAVWWAMDALFLIWAAPGPSDRLIARVPAALVVLSTAALYLCFRFNGAGLWIGLVLQLPVIFQGAVTSLSIYSPVLGVAEALIGIAGLFLIAAAYRRTRV